MENCTKYESAIKIRDVAGTPNVYTYLKTVKCSLITGQTKLSKSQSNYFYAMVEAYNRTNDVIFSMLVPLYT